MTSARMVIAYSLAAAAAPVPVHAQPAGAQAEVLFREGRDLMKAGKVAEACAAFEQSQQLEPAVTTQLNLAGCRERLGQLATAWALFADAERQTGSAPDAATEQLHEVARDRAARLEPRVSKLTIRVPDRSRLDGLEILRDRERVPAAMWNRALPIDGGTYTITARAPGAHAWSTRVTLAPEADTRTIDVPDLRSLRPELEAPPRTPAGIAPAARHRGTPPAGAPAAALPASALRVAGSPPAPRDAIGPRRSLAFPIAAGAGAVALLGGALGLSRWGDATYDDARAERVDQARRDALYDSANRKRYVAQGLAAAGVGCAGVAVWLYLRGRGAGAEPAPPRLMLAPTASGLGVAGRF